MLGQKYQKVVTAPTQTAEVPSPTKHPIKKISRLAISKLKVVDNEGKPVLLAGVTTDEFRFNGAYQNLDKLKKRLLIVRDWGVNMVVLYLQQPTKTFNRVDEIVEMANWATDNGMYTLIFPVVHEADDVPEKDRNLTREQKYFTALGKNTEEILDILSRRLKDNPGVIYGTGAEPINVPPEKLHSRQSGLISVIRKNSPDSVVVVNGMAWGVFLEPYIAKPIEATNLLYDTHRYAANRTENIKMNNCIVPNNYIGKVPFIIGEFGGVYNFGFGTPEDIECTGRFLESARENNIGFAVHTIDSRSQLGLFKSDGSLTNKGKLVEKFLKENIN